MNLLLQCFTKKYFQFKGRASRRENIYFSLCYIFIYIFLSLNVIIFTQTYVGLIVFWLMIIFSFIPSLSVTTRRLHDLNYSGWWLLFYILILIFKEFIFTLTLIYLDYSETTLFISGVNFFVGIFTWVVGLILVFKKGTPGPNRFGEEPIY